MEGFHPDWQGYLKPLIALVAPKHIQEHLSKSIYLFRPKSCFPSDKYIELKCLTYSELTNPTPTPSTTSPSRALLKSPYSTSSSNCVILGNRTGNYLGGIDILNINWMNKVRYETPALYILCFDWQNYPISTSSAPSSSETEHDQETISRLENDALGIIKSITSILKKRHSPPSVLIFVILPSGTPDPQSCVACFRRNHFPELQAIFVTCGLKHQKHLNVRIERLAEMAYETAQAYYGENERRWRKSAIKAQTAGITAQNDSFIGSLSMKTSSSGIRYSVSNSIQSSLSPRFGRNSYFSVSNSSSNSTNNLFKNVSMGIGGVGGGAGAGGVGGGTGAGTLSGSNKNYSFVSSNSVSGYQALNQLQSKVLLIRYCIKSAVMNEFCGNFALATKQYIAAWDNIMNETSIPSYQFVILCNIISLRLYHIYVINGEIQKAMSHLKIHCRTLREFGMNHPKFAFLSSLWLSQTLQKLASVLFFHLVNKNKSNGGGSFQRESSSREDARPCHNYYHQYPDGLELSSIPLSIGNNHFEKMISRVSEVCSENCTFKLDSDNLGDILSSIARSIQNIVIIHNSTQQPSNVSNGSDSAGGKTGGVETEGNHAGITIINNNSQNGTVVDILLNISKLYKTSAEYSSLSKSQLGELCAEFGAGFFQGDQKFGGEILSPLSLGCFEELSSPETFLEYERKDIAQYKAAFHELSKLSSLYIGSNTFDIDQIEDRSIASEVLASCEIVRRNIQSLLNSKSLFYRSISLYYISAVIYRHFYPANPNPHSRANLNTNLSTCSPSAKKCIFPTPAVHVDSASQSGRMHVGANMSEGVAGMQGQSAGFLAVGAECEMDVRPKSGYGAGVVGGGEVGSGSVFGAMADRFFQMISFSFAEYLFEENYITCSLSIFEAIFQSMIPKHLFAEISRLTTIDEQQSRLFGGRRKAATLWEIVNPQMTNTCFQLTGTYFDSSFWLFLDRVCLRILECLSIQNLNLEERRAIPRIVISNSSSEEKLFGGGSSQSTAVHGSSAKQDDQYIYSVVSSFLAVFKPKKTWIQSQSHSAQCKQRSSTINHCSIMVLSYLVISNSLEKSGLSCKEEIEHFYRWIQDLYRKVSGGREANAVATVTAPQAPGGSNASCVQSESPLAPPVHQSRSPTKNILFTHFLYNNYSTILQDQSHPDRIIVIVHHFPTFLKVFIDSRMEASLATNIGILGVVIKKFEVVEFEDSGSFNSQISLHCRIRHVNYVPQNYEKSGPRKLYYQEYRPPILIFGLFLYLLVSSSSKTNDYIKFGVSTLRYFNYQKSALNITENNVYNFSYVQFCLRSPPLSYFTCLGSWLRHARSLVYNTPRLQIVPGGFLDASTNSIANPVPICKVPVDDLQLLSRFCHPFNSLPIFHKLVTNNMMFGGQQLSSRAEEDEDNKNEAYSGTESIKRLCKVWILSPFDAIDVVLSESKQRADTVEYIAYNAISNEIRPLQLVLRVPEDFSEQLVLDVSVNIARLAAQDSYHGAPESELERQSDPHLGTQRESCVVSRLGILQVPSADSSRWKVVFSQGTIPSTNISSSGTGGVDGESTGTSTGTSSGGGNPAPQSSTVGRFMIGGELLRRSALSEAGEVRGSGFAGCFARLHSVLKGHKEGEVQLVGFESSLANPVETAFREEGRAFAEGGDESSRADPRSDCSHMRESRPVSFIDEGITPYFKVLRNAGEEERSGEEGVGRTRDGLLHLEREDSIFSTLSSSSGVLVFVPMFLSVSKSGRFNVSVSVKILSGRRQMLHGQGGGSCSSLAPEGLGSDGSLILHDLEQSRPWHVGECIVVNCRIPKMDTLHGSVGYLDRHGQVLEPRIVPLYDDCRSTKEQGRDGRFFLSFEITNQQLKEKIIIEDFVLPFKFSATDHRYPKVLHGNETNTSLIHISKEDVQRYYVLGREKNQNGDSVSGRFTSDVSYCPQLQVSLEYKLSCEISSFNQDRGFLQFVVFPFQAVLLSSDGLLGFGSERRRKSHELSLRSFPVKYELFSSLYNSLISPLGKFYPITLETHVRQSSCYIGTPFTYEAVITNHTSLPQPIKYSLVYPPGHPKGADREVCSSSHDGAVAEGLKQSGGLLHSHGNGGGLPPWLPLLVQGVTSSSALLGPNSTETIKWTFIPTQSGTIPLPCIHIQSERSGKQFIDVKGGGGVGHGGSSHPACPPHKSSSQPLLVSALYTLERRIVVIPRPPPGGQSSHSDTLTRLDRKELESG